MNSFSHAADANAQRGESSPVIRKPLPEVANPDGHDVVLLGQIDARILTLGVTVNIRERFLNYPKDGVFDIVRHSRKQHRTVIERNPQLPPALQTLEVPVQG